MKKSIIYILLGLLALAQYSCKKDLNALPKSQKVDGNVITDYKSAKTALNGVYYNLAEVSNTYGDPIVFIHFYSELYPAMAVGAVDYYYGSLPVTTRTQSVGDISSSEVLSTWQTNYTIINSANAVISNIETIPNGGITENDKKSVLGEAHFLRAFANFRLLWNYGQFWDVNSQYGILLRTEPTTTENIAKARSSVKETYDLILSDLDFAIANAPVTNEPYYSTSWAAKVLKSRVLMLRGGTGDYTAVIALANDVINNSPYQLENDAKDIFTSKGLSSSEVILGIKPFPNQTSKSFILYNFDYQYVTYIAGALATDIFSGDPRWNWMFAEFDGYPDIGVSKFFNLGAGNSPTRGSYSEVSYLIRLTEIYMLKAEALAKSGGNMEEAKSIVKDIMARGGVTDFSAIDNAETANDLLVEIFKENFKNFLMEDGIPWLSLLRLPFNTVKSLRPDITTVNQYIMPVPREEFELNKSFGPQNPGYSK